MRKILFSLIIAAFCNAQIVANAAPLHIELTQGMASAIPIAVVSFKGQSDSDNDPQNVAGVIRADLQDSGQFKILPESSYKQSPSSPRDINIGEWKDSNANDLVVGSVTPASGGKFQVNFSLVDMAQSVAKNTPAVLASDSMTVSAQQLRHAAHHMSDIIYQQLTGKRGIFSTRIAYVLVAGQGNNKRYMLEVADADGFNPRPIMASSEPIMSPSWSPDGQKIAYVSFENKRSAIYISDVATGARQLITSYPGINGAPAFSPDSRKLALVLSMNSNSPNLYVMDLGRHQLHQLTKEEAIDTEPRWSPHGDSIVFTSSRGGGPQIYKYDMGSGSVSRISYSGNYNATPSFTPNGQTLIVLHGEGEETFDVASMDVGSGAMSLLTRTGAASSPSIAPNGQMIIYSDNSSGRGVLGIVSIDGKIRLSLPSPDGSVREPAWSPFLG